MEDRKYYVTSSLRKVCEVIFALYQLGMLLSFLHCQHELEEWKPWDVQKNLLKKNIYTYNKARFIKLVSQKNH